jgi:hypothetical protein
MRFPDEYMRFPDQYTSVPIGYMRFPDEYTRFPDEYTRFPNEYTCVPVAYTRLSDQYTCVPVAYTWFPHRYTSVQGDGSDAPFPDGHAELGGTRTKDHGLGTGHPRPSTAEPDGPTARGSRQCRFDADCPRPASGADPWRNQRRGRDSNRHDSNGSSGECAEIAVAETVGTAAESGANPAQSRSPETDRDTGATAPQLPPSERAVVEHLCSVVVAMHGLGRREDALRTVDVLRAFLAATSADSEPRKLATVTALRTK